MQPPNELQWVSSSIAREGLHVVLYATSPQVAYQVVFCTRRGCPRSFHEFLALHGGLASWLINVKMPVLPKPPPKNMSVSNLGKPALLLARTNSDTASLSSRLQALKVYVNDLWTALIKFAEWFAVAQLLQWLGLPASEMADIARAFEDPTTAWPPGAPSWNRWLLPVRPLTGNSEGSWSDVCSNRFFALQAYVNEVPLGTAGVHVDRGSDVLTPILAQSHRIVWNSPARKRYEIFSACVPSMADMAMTWLASAVIARLELLADDQIELVFSTVLYTAIAQCHGRFNEPQPKLGRNSHRATLALAPVPESSAVPCAESVLVLSSHVDVEQVCATPRSAKEPNIFGYFDGRGECCQCQKGASEEDLAPLLTEWHPGNWVALCSVLLHRGVDPCARPRLWKVLLGIEQVKKKHTGLYRELLHTTPNAVDDDAIRKDISRTFMEHIVLAPGACEGSPVRSPSFASCNYPRHQELYRVLAAYAVYRQSVGYCQGMSFVAATLLMHLMDEEEAFLALAVLLQRGDIESYFTSDMAGLSVALDRMTELLPTAILNHMTKLKVSAFTYASSWFLSLFTASFSCWPAVLTIWDVMLCAPAEAALPLRAALAIHSVFIKEILGCTDQTALIHLMQTTIPEKLLHLSHLRQHFSVATLGGPPA
eukprot:TRINITY_DN67843_c0_g1_i1.p1 TRINITY_DN67843_c0_g1~~TRINITY_DN67843_c0_g1_i1.p1  ORF type:complete len:661 (-),score=41.11 TRINITY_DN67843_c0_g1_i1:81-2039(-)